MAGFGVNVLLRASIAAFLADVLRHPQDPRYAGKAIPWRNLVIVGGFSMLFPLRFARGRAGHGRTRRHDAYPVWIDNLYLSIFWLDMAGNALNLYDSYTHFDLIPHFHGTGALTTVLQHVFDWPPLGAFAAANGIHGLLEAQEYGTDVFCGTHNVRGWWDSAGDLIAGLLGSAVYAGLSAALPRRRSDGRERRR